MNRKSGVPGSGTVWSIILLALSLGTAFVLYTGKATPFIAARFVPLLGVTVPLAIGISLVSLFPQVRKKTSATVSAGFLVFVLPFAFGFVALATRQPATQQSVTEPFSADTQMQNNTARDLPVQNGPEQNTPAQDSPARDGSQNPPARDAEPIILTDQTFYTTYNDINYNPQPFLGREVTVTGFVHREPDLASSEFVVARLLLWCCTSDAALLGFISRATSIPIPREETWVTVTGTVGAGFFGQRKLPYLSVSSIERVPGPEFEYILPF
jgi:putative membrane protein